MILWPRSFASKKLEKKKIEMLPERQPESNLNAVIVNEVTVVDVDDLLERKYSKTWMPWQLVYLMLILFNHRTLEIVQIKNFDLQIKPYFISLFTKSLNKIDFLIDYLH